MFSSLVNLIFGGEAKQQAQEPANHVADVDVDLQDSFLDEDCAFSIGNDEDKENIHDSIDFKTDEDDDWLLIDVSSGPTDSCSTAVASNPPPPQSSSLSHECLLPPPRPAPVVAPGSLAPITFDTHRGISIKKKPYSGRRAWPRRWSDIRFQASKSQFEREACLKTSAGLHPGIESVMQKRLNHENFAQEITPQVQNTVQDGSWIQSEDSSSSSDSEEDPDEEIIVTIRKLWEKDFKLFNQGIFPDLLDQIVSVKPQQRARELNIRKHLAPSQIERQNKVRLYEGKAKNNRRKDLWRCHSGANNNRKCC